MTLRMKGFAAVVTADQISTIFTNEAIIVVVAFKQNQLLLFWYKRGRFALSNLDPCTGSLGKSGFCHSK